MIQFDYRITGKFISPYRDGFRYWLFRFFKYKNISGFSIRFLGLDINIREGNATEKLIATFKNRSVLKQAAKHV